jgi:hypothetical protein
MGKVTLLHRCFFLITVNSKKQKQKKQQQTTKINNKNNSKNPINKNTSFEVAFSAFAIDADTFW